MSKQDRVGTRECVTHTGGGTETHAGRCRPAQPQALQTLCGFAALLLAHIGCCDPLHSIQHRSSQPSHGSDNPHSQTPPPPPRAPCWKWGELAAHRHFPLPTCKRSSPQLCHPHTLHLRFLLSLSLHRRPLLLSPLIPRAASLPPPSPPFSSFFS